MDRVRLAFVSPFGPRNILSCLSNAVSIMGSFVYRLSTYLDGIRPTARCVKAHTRCGQKSPVVKYKLFCCSQPFLVKNDKPFNQKHINYLCAAISCTHRRRLHFQDLGCRMLPSREMHVEAMGIFFVATYARRSSSLSLMCPHG